MNKYNRSIKKICQANSKFKITQKKSQTTSYISTNYQLKELKINKHQKSQEIKYSSMEDHNDNFRNLYKDHVGLINIEKQQLLDKENYLKLDSYNNEKNNSNSGNNNGSNNILRSGSGSNDRNHPDCTDSGRCLQDNVIENQNDAHSLEQQQSIFCTAYNQYHADNSHSQNISVNISGSSKVNSNNNMSKKESYDIFSPYTIDK